MSRPRNVPPETEELVSKLVPLLMGLTPIEWRRIKRAVDQSFSKETAKVTLTDEEEVTTRLLCLMT